MNSKLILSIAIFLFSFFNMSRAQVNQVKNIQLQLEGMVLDTFTLEIRGSEVYINGRIADSSHVKYLLVKKDIATGNKIISEHGIEYQAEMKSAPVQIVEPPYKGSPWLGLVTVQDGKGIKVVEVVKNGPASKTRILPGDYISTIDELKINNLDQLSDLVNAKSPGEKIEIKLIRDETVKIVPVIIGDKNSGEIKRSYSKVDQPQMNGGRQIGMQLKLTQDSKYWKVVSITSGSRAQSAGLNVNDIILEMNGVVLKPGTDLAELMSEIGAGTEILLKVKRAGKVLNIKMP